MIDRRAMYLVGLVFVVIAASLSVKELLVTFSLRDLLVAAGWGLGGLFVLLAVIAAEVLKGAAKAAAAVAFAVVGFASAAGLLFFIGEKGWYISSVVFTVLAVYLVVRTQGDWSRFDLRGDEVSTANVVSVSVWFALVLSTVACAWASYYRFVATAEDISVTRRLVFTLCFIVAGVACCVAGRSVAQPFLSIAGLTYMGIGVTKALVYDTTHLTGFLRIAVFAGGGVVLLIGGALLSKKREPAKADEAAPPLPEAARLDHRAGRG